MENFCEICGKKYGSRTGLWKHKKNNHLEKIGKKIKEINTCKYCEKKLSCRQSKWRHEKKCKNDVNIIQTINEMKTKISQLETKPNIVNYTTNNNNTTNNNIQNIIIPSPPGFESIEYLNSQQKKFIMNKGLSSLMYLIETTNFDKQMPQNHSYCVTALNDKHASMVDTKTNSIIKTDKIELFDKVLAGNLKKMETFCTDKSFTYKERENFKDVVERLKNILFKGKRGIKKYYNEINLLSYNNKELIMDTWNSLKKLDEMIMSCGISNSNNLLPITNKSDYESESETDIESDDEVNSKKLEDFRKKFPSIKPIIKPRDDDSESESESDSEDEVLEIVIKGTSYLIDNNQVYVKNKNGTKGQIYGTYSNGKVKRIKEFDV